jgi:hypothetical protein
MLPRLLVRVGLILAYIPLVILAGLYRREEIRHGLAAVRQRLRSGAGRSG